MNINCAVFSQCGALRPTDSVDWLVHLTRLTHISFQLSVISFQLLRPFFSDNIHNSSTTNTT